MTSLKLDADRALPFPTEQRSVAREIYGETKDLPLICMHGHVEPEVFADDMPFADPAQLLIVPDHYVFRMLASQGIEPARLGVPRLDGGPVETDSRKIWRTFCENWKLFRGTPSRYWLEHELVEVFGVDLVPSAETADAIYDQIAACVADPGFRPRALLDRFNIEVISTTDAATSDCSTTRSSPPTAWASACCRPSGRTPWSTSIGRPGAPTSPSWRRCPGSTPRPTTASSTRCVAPRGLRRGGCPGHRSRPLAGRHHPDGGNAARELYSRMLDGAEPSEAEVDAFAANMLFQMAEMSCEDGLVMQIHPGVLRDHNSTIVKTYGQDKGYDIPIQTEFTRALRPMLDRFGTDPRFRVILFTVDETSFSRELAPIAGTYPSVRLGAPWWFLDSPEGMRRFRESAIETAGFYNTSGFVDDTRAYASIPARHDLFRRVDAGYLARLVLEHRLGLDEAVETAIDLAYNLPKESYAPPLTRLTPRSSDVSPDSASPVVPNVTGRDHFGSLTDADSGSQPRSQGVYWAYGANGARCFTKWSAMMP